MSGGHRPGFPDRKKNTEGIPQP